ncbi:type IX secretion system sortase PorU [Plebeiibacterium sediminum]|uniref:Type IX secretion system sortase PorU n=1 Tax=Plebeiibacterium sediminum TaxID=2992112 RepID=A0AAE3M5H8_9BACT|nr:type IX secretion system sortase PorU [Plebeiobacterium sediminum]MCW3787504.1 type IX secretion system sortase PorU [Plebeiobacterium sediminum]
MNIYKLGLWGCLLLFSINLLGQEKLSFNRKIEWDTPFKISDGENDNLMFNFTGMDGFDEESNLPSYFESFPLPLNADIQTIKIYLTDVKFIWPLPEEHAHYKDSPISDSVIIHHNISHSGNQFYTDVNIIPLKKEKTASSFQKLVSFNINIEYRLNNKTTLKAASTTSQYAINSVLSSGNWKKIRVDKTGIYKITYNQLEQWGISNPQNVGIYGNGGKLIPQKNNEYREDDLVENAIWHYNNAVYFFAEGPVVWKYDYTRRMYTHTKHPFSNYSYYFISEKSVGSETIENSSLQTNSYDTEINNFVDYDYHEENNINLFGSGNKWFGEKFEYYDAPTQDFSFSFSNIDPSINAQVYIALASKSGNNATFKALYNNAEIGSRIISSVNTSDHLSYFAREGIISTSFTPGNDDVSIALKYEAQTTNSIGYLDYITINAVRNLKFEADELRFRYANPNQFEEHLKFNIEDVSGSLIVWDVTNPLKPSNITTEINNNSLTFNYITKEAKEFVAFNPSGSFPTPTLVGDVDNQNLHGLENVDYLIVCHPDFINEAERLGKIHQEYNGLTYTVVTTNQIYNEFSSGKPDVTAIRSFAKMFYDRAGDDENLKPKNLLLFGDGSYDNRPGSDFGKIITYESDNSIHQTNSYVSDDYFGLLDDDEGSSITSEKIDIGIGRFPVNTLTEAKNAVDKTYRYLYNQALDSWKSKVTFVGDDGDSNIHMDDANKLAEKVNSLYPQFNINKVYFDAYEKIQSSTNAKFPDVEEKIEEAIHEGTLIFNYTGHGGPEALAHERVITIESIEQWQNYNKLPVFVTATCEFSRFDNHENNSAGELIFTHELGGGIALFTTTRIVYSSLNYKVNNSFYDNVFELDENGEPLTLGEIMKRTKHNSGSSVNKLNFTLLGDPALKLIYPHQFVKTLSLNNVSVDDDIDELSALSLNTIKGEITDINGNFRPDFNGEVYVSIYDKRSLISTLNNTNQGVFQFEDYTTKVFSGKSEVVNGLFECEFIVPKDIRYNSDYGKVSYYASSEDNNEAFGSFNEITIGGFSDNADQDTKGPEISLFANQEGLTEMGPTPVLFINLFDESGINTTGNGIGHDITCVVDGNNSNPIILNSYYNPEINNYQRGTITYQLPQLESGSHTITIKAWDVFNNSSSASISINTDNESAVVIENSKVYPNPVTSGETAYFYFEHDEPNSILNLTINIYSKNGDLVSQMDESVVSLFNTIPPVEWNVDLRPGMYLYEIIINSETGRKGKVSGKIVVSP